MRSAKWGVVVLLAAWGMPFDSAQGKAASAQQQSETQAAQKASQQTPEQKQERKQQDPLAEAARRAREEKRQQPKATKVFDNDNIPKKPGSISVVGETTKPAENASATAATATEKTEGGATAAATAEPSGNEKAGTDEQKKAELEKELAEAKEHLQTVTTDLDIATRKYTLDQQTYYGKPNVAADEEGAAALKVEESLIASKKQEAANAQKKVDDLEEKLKELKSIT